MGKNMTDEKVMDVSNKIAVDKVAHMEVDEASDAKKPEQNGKKAVKKEQQKDRFRYGNYTQYYGHRLEGKFERDPRLDLFREEWFRGKNVLDIGCNAGVITILIAKEFGPKKILGIDICPILVGNARKNIRHYCEEGTKLSGKLPEPSKSKDDAEKFPNNVWFIYGNYVLDSDVMLEMVIPEYNVILALSITKWIHLNWGDAGIKRFFHRIYKHLQPNGKLILETQDIKTYGKRARGGSEEMKKHYKEIRFLPEQFNDFLLNEVGFKDAINLGVPQGSSKGFSRPLVVYNK